MLIVNRKITEKIIINKEIIIKILKIKKNIVKIGINAPKNILIYRNEIYKKFKKY